LAATYKEIFKKEWPFAPGEWPATVDAGNFGGGLDLRGLHPDNVIFCLAVRALERCWLPHVRNPAVADNNHEVLGAGSLELRQQSIPVLETAKAE
jgi:hypothetical protein